MFVIGGSPFWFMHGAVAYIYFISGTLMRLGKRKGTYLYDIHARDRTNRVGQGGTWTTSFTQCKYDFFISGRYPLQLSTQSRSVVGVFVTYKRESDATPQVAVASHH